METRVHDLSEVTEETIDYLEAHLASLHIKNAARMVDQGRSRDDAFLLSTLSMIQALLLMSSQYAASMDKTDPNDLGVGFTTLGGGRTTAVGFFVDQYEDAFADEDIPPIYTSDWIV